jgi:hypothetical protein
MGPVLLASKLFLLACKPFLLACKPFLLASKPFLLASSGEAAHSPYRDGTCQNTAHKKNKQNNASRAASKVGELKCCAIAKENKKHAEIGHKNKNKNFKKSNNVNKGLNISESQPAWSWL